MNRDLFINDLKKVLKKHRVWLSGTLKIRGQDGWDHATSGVKITDISNYGGIIDRSGPFLGFHIEQSIKYLDFDKKPVKTVIVDRDKLLSKGVVSPLDQKTAFHNRQDWADHLKRNGCVEIGNDFNNSTQKKREIKGDFDCRKELAQATQQVIG